MKTSELILVAAILILFYLAVAGCASTGCRAPETRAAERGVLLECRRATRDGKPYRNCLIMAPGGNTINVAYKQCPQN
jgi:hypothetical protein